ncbi:PREDICTED: uncharacterized protein LOC108969079 isoform X2 [Bactrocera latifrons]|uniref:uncharacterized protein LOC108969079 isoform X2 n=1 Tax=Bactrocera latifrons TaxID=174628 RepID=UPI0008DCFC54|nr:PREDICTED: uncharacterized protein LOC108969079 isoform X2 [Bactrocera latifrons]
METQQTQQTEKLIEDMLEFLDSTSEDEDDSNNMKSEQGNAKESYENANEHTGNSLSRLSKKERKSKRSFAKELSKIKNEFPIWNTKEIAPTSKKLTDPIWHQSHIPAGKCETTDIETDWNSKLESNCRRSSNTYVQEVNRAIYGDTTGHPPNDSTEYFQAAQNYAIYGKDFLDFPENLTPLLNVKSSSTPPEAVPFVSGYGNGLYPTPQAPETTTGIGFANLSQSSAASSAATAAYYQMCNGLQPASVRPAAGSTAYGMFLGNKVTYVAAAPAAPPLVYNQHSSTTTNFISNSLANAALATSPTILYSNPMLTTTTQQYLNTFFKETQYLSGATTQGSTVGTATGIYERLVYAQMLQQQIYHQTQQQAAAVAAMFHKSRPTRATNGGGGATAPCAQNSATQTMPSSNNIPGLNICGRQAAMVTNATDMLVKTPPVPSPIVANGNEDNVTTLNDL